MLSQLIKLLVLSSDTKLLRDLLDKDERIKKFVRRREQGLPAIDYFEVCDSITILKQTMV